LKLLRGSEKALLSSAFNNSIGAIAFRSFMVIYVTVCCFAISSPKIKNVGCSAVNIVH